MRILQERKALQLEQQQVRSSESLRIHTALLTRLKRERRGGQRHSLSQKQIPKRKELWFQKEGGKKEWIEQALLAKASAAAAWPVQSACAANLAETVHFISETSPHRQNNSIAF